MSDVAEVLRVQADVVRLGEDDGRTALLVDGVVQSISPADGDERGGYWAAMVPLHQRPSRALILGLGGGTLARLLARRWGPDRIVGVDSSPDVVALARTQGWLDEVPGLEVVTADAFAYVHQQAAARGGERFGYVAVDLYRGRQFVAASLNKGFLQAIRTLLEPPALLAVNLFNDARLEARIERIGRVCQIQARVQVKDNVIVHARCK